MVLLFAVGLLSVSCDSRRVSDDYVSFKGANWHKDSVARFETVITDSTLRYNVELKIRNTEDYINRNIWLFIKCKAPDGEVTEDIKKDIPLADDEGRWLGKGAGNIYESVYQLKKNYRFEHCGKYTFEVVQGMRAEVIAGIRDIGLRVESSEE